MRVARLFLSAGGGSSRLVIGVLALASAFSIPCEVIAQAAAKAPPRPAGTEPRWKGIWEPVNYAADVNLHDVFFVTADVGWVSGGTEAKGSSAILHTRDGGKTWNVQLGDPEGTTDRPYEHLRFVDETHGWVTQRTGGPVKLLRTTDGQSWEEVGTLPGHFSDYGFTSASVGWAIHGDDILRSGDGGASWRDASKCAATTEVEGLTRRVTCQLRALHFPTPSVGYAVGGARGVNKAFVLMKTADGGDNWSVSVIPAEHYAEEVFFTDAESGVIRLWGGKVIATSDGGKTWRGVPVQLHGAPQIKFVDKNVGWSAAYRTLSFTTDGGRRWLAREIAFPAHVNAFALPRRDRGYVVGDHGMIYRYRVIPIAETVAKALPAPAMPKP